jgi:carbamoyltransferase
MYVLGLSALEHDSSAALVSEQGIVAAMEESKLLRVAASGGIPHAAIRFCLDRAGIEWRDLDAVAVASRPLHAWAREAWLRARRSPFAPVAGAYFLTKAFGELGRELNNFRALKVMDGSSRARILNLEHHLCHAASAFYASPFDRAVILTLDEQGDGWSSVAALGEGTRIRILRSCSFPDSVGWLYSQVTALLGFQPRREEHKTQWLSLEGEPAFEKVFEDILGRPSRGLPRLDLSYFKPSLVGATAFSDKFFRRLGFESEDRFQLTDALRRQLAASLQQACARVLVACAEDLCRETGVQNVCLAGGVFLNALLVTALEKSVGLNQVFAQPAAGNTGCALGSAWLTWHQVLGKPRLDPMSTLHWGPRYSTDEIKYVLDNCKARYRWFDTEAQRIEATRQALEQGEIVAWHQGAVEFGPRALGNRSILASPWTPYIKENLNHYVKHREPFRPFAIAVPEEDCSRYFECSRLVRFMATLGWVRPETRDLVKDFVLPGDQIRLYAVDRKTNPLLWQLLKEWGKRSPAPFLVNTSFNLFGEPLVVTPRDAVRSFFCSGIDALLIGGFFLSK